jgi:cytochrome c-type biogenesis protein CcmH
MFWLIIGAMLATAILVVVIPVYRVNKQLTASAVISMISIAAVAGVMYSFIGTPRPAEHAQQESASIEEMIESLTARLQENPDDLNGWKMLGRSHMQTQNFPGAIAAYEKAVQMESSENGATLADLGESILMNDPQEIFARAGQLFENALALDGANPKALFYSGMAAVQRGDNALAADRWEALLATSPPPNVQEILRQRIAELRGEALEPETAVAPAESASISIAVSLGDKAALAGIPDATVYIIARDPKQPAPPIAAVRRRVSDLPTTVNLSDDDAMVAGRVPSAYSQLEIIARISLSGQPVAQSGDWFGQQLVETVASGALEIVIDQQVP